MKRPPWILKVKKLIVTPKAFGWCTLPYPGHPKGCPNAYGRCSGKRHLFTDLVDTAKPIYIVYNEFNVRRHARKMKRLHPDWTTRQCRNLLYWQSRSFSGLEKRIEEAMKILKPKPNFVSSGEGQGVNVYATCRHSGLILDPIKGGKLKICRHLALLAYKQDNKRDRRDRKAGSLEGKYGRNR